jgi:hypothetical protein
MAPRSKISDSGTVLPSRILLWFTRFRAATRSLIAVRISALVSAFSSEFRGNSSVLGLNTC